MKILISDPIEQSCVDILTREGFQVDLKPGIPPEEIKKIIPEYAALIVRSGTKVTADIIQEAHAMKVIGRAGAGVDNIDVEAASRSRYHRYEYAGGQYGFHRRAHGVDVALSFPQHSAGIHEFGER